MLSRPRPGETLITRTDAYGLALDVEAGKMYWTAYLSPLTIQRANLDLDGDERELVLRDAAFPTHIALDVEAGKMYWTSHCRRSDSPLYRRGTSSC